MDAGRGTELATETVFTWGGPSLKFGVGATDELGFDLSRLGVERALIVTDRGVAGTGIPERVQASLLQAGMKAEVFDGVHVEPTDQSLIKALGFASGSEWDGFVAVGGGSSIDTAKAMNLMYCYPGDVMEYVNRPVGRGTPPPGPVKPLVAVPTTAGTGSESTPVCVLDILGLRIKTGISHPGLRPVLAVVDPLNTLTLPPEATAASGMDVVCHALESYTARPYTAYARKAAEERVAYCGSNPISDLWCERALGLIAGAFRKAVLGGNDLDARTSMMLAATFAGMGFGNAGVHIPHACGYPIAGMVKDYRPPGYEVDEPMVPHGQSVSVTAPAAFRFTFSADPARHVRAAELLGGDASTDASTPADPKELLPEVLVSLMHDVGLPNGVAALGFGEEDIEALVEGTLMQQRLLVISPQPPTGEDLADIFRSSMENW
ncbi:MAG: hydroxyacid-oxoacid transhydrogenase [Actinomycetota bacterium]